MKWTGTVSAKWLWITVHFGPKLETTMPPLRRFLPISMMSVTTLAMGIAAITAMFSIYSRIVLKPVTIAHPEKVLTIYGASNGIRFIPPALSCPKFRLIQQSATLFAHVGAYSNEAVNITAEGPVAAQQLRGLRVSGRFFTTIDAVPFRGRLFTPEDDVPNGPAVCILSYELWQSRFGGRDLTGTNVQLSGKSTQVVGILAPRLSSPWADREIFLPRVFDDSGLTPQTVENGATFLEVIGRLRDGATAPQAAQQLQAISQEYTTRFANRSDSSSHLELRPLVDTVTGGRGPVFLLLLGGVGVVMLISCVNATALILSRLISREREIAIRQALGASRTRIVLQFVGESLATAAVAGVIGFLAARVTLRLATSALSAQIPPGVQLELDRVAALAGIGAVLVCGALVGIVPSLYATRPAKRSALAAFVRGGSEGTSTRDVRALLVTAEVALSTLLLVGTALLVSSLDRLQRTSPGFDPAGVAAGFVNLSSDRYASPERQQAFFLGVVDRLNNHPQVSGAAVVFGLPFYGENSASPYSVSGRPILAPADRPRAGLRLVSENYFKVMRMKILEGRTFEPEDRAGAPLVCIVNQSLARRQFGATSAVGQVIRRGRNADQFHKIVGVVADVKTNGVRQPTPHEIFYPFRQVPRATAAIVVRSEADPAALG
jgi:predicted permease